MAINLNKFGKDIQNTNETENSSSILTEYEKLFKSLQKQIETYEIEQETLKAEITKIVTENTNLSKKLKEAYEIKIDKVSENLSLKENSKEIIDNLKSQLTFSSEEKTTTYELWQNSLKIIDYLETELKLYKQNDFGFINRIDHEREKKKLTTEIRTLQKQLKIENDKSSTNQNNILLNLEQKNSELSLALEGQKSVLNLVQEKDSEITELRDRLSNLMHTCEKLKNEIEKQDKIIKNYSAVENESRVKVLESVLITEAAMVEKESAIKRETKAKEQIKVLTNSLNEIVKEADEKIKKEKEIIKDQYNENLTKLLKDMKQVESNLNDKNLDLEQQIRRNKMLEEEMQFIKRGNVTMDDTTTTKLLILEKNLESTFQKLLLSERRYLQINSEKESIQMDLDQMVQTFERDRKTLEISKDSLAKKIKSLQRELKVSNQYVDEYAAQISELNAKIEFIKNETENAIQKKERMFEEILSEKILQIKNDSFVIQKEMNSHLKSEHKLNRRWMQETKEIVDQLQNRITELKIENKDLRLAITKGQISSLV